MSTQPLLTYKEIADITKCSVSGVRKWVASHQLKVIKMGHRTVRVREDDFKDFLRRSTKR